MTTTVSPQKLGIENPTNLEKLTEWIMDHLGMGKPCNGLLLITNQDPIILVIPIFLEDRQLGEQCSPSR